jgi:fibrillarin-like pre-rRNA processing protein
VSGAPSPRRGPPSSEYHRFDAATLLEVGPPPERPTFWTRGLGDPPSRYAERIRWRGEEAWRFFDPTRSKLAAALCRGLPEVPFVPGQDVLYLGASTGTTASHVADLVGPGGRVFAVELSARVLPRLLLLAREYPNVHPILADARDPASYFGDVPEVPVIYQDVAQPDQVGIARENARLFLRPGGWFLLALKRASLFGKAAERAPGMDLGPGFRAVFRTGLEPFHRDHTFLVFRYGDGPSPSPGRGPPSKSVRRAEPASEAPR